MSTKSFEFGIYRTSSNMRQATNMYRPLISATQVTLRLEQALPTNKRLPQISVAPQNVTLIENMTTI